MFLQASPGAAMAQEITGHVGEVLLVLTSVSVIVGVLLLWSYIKQTVGPGPSRGAAPTETVREVHEWSGGAPAAANFESRFGARYDVEASEKSVQRHLRKHGW